MSEHAETKVKLASEARKESKGWTRTGSFLGVCGKIEGAVHLEFADLKETNVANQAALRVKLFGSLTMASHV